MSDFDVIKRNVLDLDLAELREVVSAYGEKPYRAEQLFAWTSKGIKSFDDMRNVPKDLRAGLAAEYYIGLPDIAESRKSKDGSVKCLIRFNDGVEVEAVFMKYTYGNSVCISSQAGCRMGCSFCASTMDGLERNLTGGEMLSEVLAVRNLTGEDINHVVIMGMGEPMDNYDEVHRFIRLIHEPKGYNLSLRNITVSTCGIIPGIARFSKDLPQVNLAISLHAPNQELREKTMPVAKKYHFNELIRACKEYTVITGRRITFEYALIDGINDTEACATELSSKLAGMLAHVNLIPLNEVEGRDYIKPAGEKILKFKECLENKGIAVTVRRTLGSDIDAACGQLRRRNNHKCD